MDSVVPNNGKLVVAYNFDSVAGKYRRHYKDPYIKNPNNEHAADNSIREKMVQERKVGHVAEHDFNRAINNATDVFMMTDAAHQILLKRKKPDQEYTASLKMRGIVSSNNKKILADADDFFKSSPDHRKKHMEDLSLRCMHDGSVYELLEGGETLLAARKIPKGKLIGVLTGVIRTKDEYKNACTSYDVLGLNRDDYAFELGKGLILDAFEVSSQMSLINDGTLKDNEGKKDVERINVEFVVYNAPVTFNEDNFSIPVVLVVTSRELVRKNELWIRYGEDFWAIKKRREKENMHRISAGEHRRKIEKTRYCHDITDLDLIMNQRIIEMRDFSDIARMRATLTYKRVLNRFNKAMAMMVDAVDEARNDGCKRAIIVNHELIKEVSTVLGIDVKLIVKYVATYQGSARKRNLLKIINAISDKSVVNLSDIRDKTGLRKATIAGKMLLLVDLHDKYGDKGIARAYTIPMDEAKRIGELMPKVKDALKAKEKNKWEKLDPELMASLVDITCWRLAKGYAAYSKECFEKIDASETGLTAHSVAKYLYKIEIYLEQREKEKETLLKKLGFTECQIRQCRDAIDKHKILSSDEEAKRFFRFVIDGSHTEKNKAVALYKNKYEVSREDLCFSLYIKKLKQRSDKEAIEAYGVDQEELTKWRVEIDVLSKKRVIKRRLMKFTDDAPPEKKKKRSARSELLVLKCTTKKDRDQILTELINKYGDVNGKEVRVWHKCATKDLKSLTVRDMSEKYGVDEYEMKYLMQNYAARTGYTVRLLGENEARQKFVQLYLSDRGTVNFQRAKDDFNKEGYGVSENKLIEWMREWKSLSNKDKGFIAAHYEVSSQRAESWIKIWNRKGMKKTGDLPGEVLKEFFDACYCYTGAKPKVVALDIDFATKNGLGQYVLQERRIAFARMVKNGDSLEEIASYFKQKPIDVKRWANSISKGGEKRKKERSCFREEERRLFRALWSDGSVKNAGEKIFCLFGVKSRTPESGKYRKSYVKARKLILGTKASQGKFSTEYGISLTEIRGFKKNILQQKRKIEGGERPAKHMWTDKHRWSKKYESIAKMESEEACSSIESKERFAENNVCDDKVKKVEKDHSSGISEGAGSSMATSCGIKIEPEEKKEKDSPSNLFDMFLPEGSERLRLFSSVELSDQLIPENKAYRHEEDERCQHDKDGTDEAGNNPLVPKRLSVMPMLTSGEGEPEALPNEIISGAPIINCPEKPSINFSHFLPIDLVRPVSDVDSLLKKAEMAGFDQELVYAGFSYHEGLFTVLTDSENWKQQKLIQKRYVHRLHEKSRFQSVGFSEIWASVVQYDDFFRKHGVSKLIVGADQYFEFLKENNNKEFLCWLKTIALANSLLLAEDKLAQLALLWTECTHVMAVKESGIECKYNESQGLFSWEMIAAVIDVNDVKKMGIDQTIYTTQGEMPEGFRRTRLI